VVSCVREVQRAFEALRVSFETDSNRLYPWPFYRLGISDKVIQQILRHANVTTTINIYVKTVSRDATAEMKTLETMCATTVQPMPLASTRVI
jgi:hypothetical protein